MTQEEFKKSLKEGLASIKDKTIVNEASKDEYDIYECMQITQMIEAHKYDEEMFLCLAFHYMLDETAIEELKFNTDFKQAIFDGNVAVAHSICRLLETESWDRRWAKRK